jgi:hypothetical protein
MTTRVPEDQSSMYDYDLRPHSLGLIVGWDEESSVAFRDPWFTYLEQLHRLGEWEDYTLHGTFSTSMTSGRPRLFYFSPEAFGIQLMQAATDPVKSFLITGLEIPTGFLRMGDIPCPYFPPDFPLCNDLVQATKLGELTKPDASSPADMISKNFRMFPTFVIKSSGLPAYRQWAESHRELVAIWTDSTFKRLRQVDPEVMRKIIRREWVGSSEMPNRVEQPTVLVKVGGR